MSLQVSISMLIVTEDHPLHKQIVSILSQDPQYQICCVLKNEEAVREKLDTCSVQVAVVFLQEFSLEARNRIKHLASLYGLPVVVVLQEDNAELWRVEESGIFYLYYTTNLNAQIIAAQLRLKLRLVIANAIAKKTREHMSQSSKPPLVGEHKISPNDRRIIAIGASAGGVEAVLSVLKDLPTELPGIVVTQHMPEGFTEMYAARLDKYCKLRVVQAKNNQRVEPGTVYIAPGNYHMVVRNTADGYIVNVIEGEKVTGHRPSVNVLFESVAKSAGKNALGIILTGMETDGAKGLLKMREAGAFTIGQDEKTAFIYGMPRAAFLAGAVCKQASLQDIPRMILDYVYPPDQKGNA